MKFGARKNGSLANGKRGSGWLSPFEDFVNSQVATGIFLFAATALALVVANSPLHDAYESVRHWTLGIDIHVWRLEMPLLEWINQGLMALFFFLIGLELKREVLAGELRQPGRFTLVICAATGGMMMPALIFLLLNHGTPGMEGWAIPMATDTAFALGALALLGSGRFSALAVLLTAIAIVDDIASILVIALYYTQAIDWPALGRAAAMFCALVFFSAGGVRRASMYFLAGLLLWLFVLQSGMHATVAGILTAMAVPARRKKRPRSFLRRMRRLIARFDREHKKFDILSDQKQHELVMDIEHMAEEATTPLQRWESKTENPIGLIILPLFAFFNAGIYIKDHDFMAVLSSPLTLGITLGLAAGKPLGITLFSWCAVRCGLCRLPQGITFSHIVGSGLLAGMGFTMSFLIATLSFREGGLMIEQAKVAILAATFISGGAGLLWLWREMRRPAPSHAPAA